MAPVIDRLHREVTDTNYAPNYYQNHNSFLIVTTDDMKWVPIGDQNERVSCTAEPPKFRLPEIQTQKDTRLVP